MVFIDFDYINPVTQMPHGAQLDQPQMGRLMAETTTRSMQAFKNARNDQKYNPYSTNMQRNSAIFGQTVQTDASLSPGKSIYVASEAGSSRKVQAKKKKMNKSLRLGGHVTPLRALQNVLPVNHQKDARNARNADLDARSMISHFSGSRFASLQPKPIKRPNMTILPKIKKSRVND